MLTAPKTARRAIATTRAIASHVVERIRVSVTRGLPRVPSAEASKKHMAFRWSESQAVAESRKKALCLAERQADPVRHAVALPDDEASSLQAIEEAADLRVRERCDAHEVPLQDRPFGLDDRPHQASLVTVEEADREVRHLLVARRWRAVGRRTGRRRSGLGAGEEQVCGREARDEGRDQDEDPPEDDEGLREALMRHDEGHGNQEDEQGDR